MATKFAEKLRVLRQTFEPSATSSEPQQRQQECDAVACVNFSDDDSLELQKFMATVRNFNEFLSRGFKTADLETIDLQRVVEWLGGFEVLKASLCQRHSTKDGYHAYLVNLRC